MHEKDIRLTVEYDGETFELNTYEGEYRSLMMLIYDNIYTSEFGECKGMGRCATCLIEVRNSTGELEGMKRNEENTIKKMQLPEPNLRLACQIPVDHYLQGIEVKIWQS